MNVLKIGTHVLGSIAFAAMQWAVLVFISKYMGVDSAGAFSYYLAIFSPLAIFCALNLKSIYSADVSKKFSLEQYEGVRTYFIACYLFLGIFFLSINEDYLLIGIVIFLVKLIEIFAELIYGKWVSEGNPQYFGYSKIIKLSLFLAFSAIILSIGNPEFIYLFYPIAFFLGYIIYDKRKSKVKLDFIKFNKLKEVFFYILPFVATSFLISLNTSIPRFYIDFYYDKKIVAEFMYLIYFLTIMLLPLNSAFQALLPKIKTRKKAGFIFTLIYSLCFSLFFFIFCEKLLSYFYNYEEYIPAKVKFALVLMMLLQSLVVYINMLYVSSMKFKKIFQMTLINTVIIVVLNYFFINHYGYYGVYYASCLSSLMLFLNLCNSYLKDKGNVV